LTEEYTSNELVPSDDIFSSFNKLWVHPCATIVKGNIGRGKDYVEIKQRLIKHRILVIYPYFGFDVSKVVENSMLILWLYTCHLSILCIRLMIACNTGYNYISNAVINYLNVHALFLLVDYYRSTEKALDYIIHHPQEPQTRF
jgi:hypothetical protein